MSRAVKDTFSQQIASLLHQISNKFGERLRRSGLVLEWEIVTTGPSKEARLYFWRCDDTGNRLNDLFDILEFPLDKTFRTDFIEREIADWLTERIDEIIQKGATH